jgi:hypothetical protein
VEPLSSRAGDAADTQWGNPFCGGTVDVVPWDASDDAPSKIAVSNRYVLQMVADGKTDAAATVTLITASDAYSVEVPRTQLTSETTGGGHYAPAMMVTFDKPTDVHYAFVDAIGVDGADPAPCPTVVQAVEPYDTTAENAGSMPHMSGGVGYVAAKYLQALPELTCGKAYIGPQTKNTDAIVGHYGNTPRTTVVRVYIDSNGLPMNPTILQSSGVEGLDYSALGGIQASRFTPARFLCTPVVSTMIIDMEYKP